MTEEPEITTADLDEAADRVLARWGVTHDDLIHDCGEHGHYEASYRPGGPCIWEAESAEAWHVARANRPRVP